MASNTLKLGLLNVKGVMRNALYVDHLLKKNDIDMCVICEHWLFSDSLHFLDSISEGYLSLGICDASLNSLDPYRRGKGVIAILWKKAYHL